MESVRLSPLSHEQIRFPVYADSNGVPVDPTGYTVEAAFMGGDDFAADPDTGDWKAATWETTVTGNYVAAAAVGPGSVNVLTVDTYRCWVRITSLFDDIQIVRQVGQLVVE
jgi:hypothetical protein